MKKRAGLASYTHDNRSAFIGLFFGILMISLAVTGILSINNFSSTPKAAPIQLIQRIFTWSPNGVPDATNNTASLVLSKLNANGQKATQISRWTGSGWSTHLLQLPKTNNFAIKEGEGYMIRFSESVAADYEKYLIAGSQSPTFTWTLNSGNNGLGLTDKMFEILKGGSNNLNGQMICDQVKAQGNLVTRVGNFVGASVKLYNCGSNAQNLVLNSREVIFVTVSKPGSFKLVPTVPTGTVTPAPKVVSWLPLGITGTPGADWDTAKELLMKLKNAGFNVEEIDRYTGNGWSAHFINLPFNNFAIKAGEGYFLKFVGASTSPVNQALESTPASTLAYTLSTGRSMISIPSNFVSDFQDAQGQVTTKSVCEKFNNLKEGITEISLQKEGTVGTEWTAYLCNDDTYTPRVIKDGEGFLVLSKVVGVWDFGTK